MLKSELSTPPLAVIARSLSPKAEALVWLQQAQVAQIEFRVPIEVKFSFQGIHGCTVGLAATADSIDVEVDDSRLGMSLAMRADQFCKGGKTCAMWVWANWRDGTLVVNRVEAAIGETDRGLATHFYIAK